eukprot:TRINITY_DN5470_c0_g2_i1.p1 TRINITY_DN5470_c0_g2~~TRINITY_DN5470_c0_g2_i1.p1  ORF type:complete len:793 (+),score=98.55 TRINITY_DN5470_c0_g2_i1:169-2547(+)
MDLDLVGLTHTELLRPELAALHGLTMLNCWPPYLDLEAVVLCCGGEHPGRHDCFGGTLTRERCCPESFEESPEIVGGDESPAMDEAPWELDDACAAHWIDPTIRAENLANEAAARRARGGVCGREPWVQWDGEAVVAVPHPAGSSDMSVEFDVLDLSACQWGSDVCLAVVRHLPQLLTATRPKGSRGHWQSSGGRWIPPPNVTAVIAFRATDAAAKSDASLPQVQVVPLLQRRAPFRSEDRGAGQQSSKAWQPSLYVLTLDSVSRSSFRLVMPRTFEFLTRLAAAPHPRSAKASHDTPEIPRSHVSFDFGRYHTLSYGGTLSQMFPFFFGGLRRSCDSFIVQQGGRLHLYNLSNALKRCAAFPGGGALGSLQKSGYRLAVSFTDAGFGSIVRDALKWDHVMPYLADVLGKVFGKSAEGDVADVDFMCTGSGHYYELMLEWNLRALELHRGRDPLFLYSHSLAAHLREWIVAGMDVAIRDHLEKVLTQNPNLVVALVADHGSTGVYCDQKAPILHIIAPRSLLRQRPDMARALEANRHAVVSPFDWFSTLRHLAGEGKGGEFMQDLRARGLMRLRVSPAKPYQEQLVLDVAPGSHFAPQSLLSRMSPNRSCGAAGIPAVHCTVRKRRLSGAPASPLKEPLYCQAYHLLSEVTQEKLSPQQKERAVALNPESDEEVGILCKVAELVLGTKLVGELNRRIREAGPKSAACKALSWGSLERIQGEGRASKTYWLRFSVREGDPPRVFDARVFVRRFERILQMHVLHIAQVTRYRKYESCTPPGARAELCVCEDRLT